MNRRRDINPVLHAHGIAGASFVNTVRVSGPSGGAGRSLSLVIDHEREENMGKGVQLGRAA